MTVLSSAWQGGNGQKQACIVGGLLFDSGSLQIRWQTVRGGATIRVAVAGLMLGLWLVLVALMAVADGLGGHDAEGRRALRAAVHRGIAQPLARVGIELDAARLAELTT